MNDASPTINVTSEAPRPYLTYTYRPPVPSISSLLPRLLRAAIIALCCCFLLEKCSSPSSAHCTWLSLGSTYPHFYLHRSDLQFRATILPSCSPALRR
ncbi:hypothetical protein CFRS1_v005221 [Colletotrichum fructicola]|nr:hypothetical protein CFRS1_v005221 [Colletotrichum fructicola]